MKKVIFIIAFCLISISAYANISIYLDKNVVTEGDTFTLSISGIKAHIVTMPQDVQDVLEKDFNIVGTARKHSFDSATFSQTSTLSVMLKPKKTGVFVIPSFSVEGTQSQPIRIEVVKNPKHIQAPEGNGDIFIKSFVDNENPYIGEQVIYTVKVYDSLGSSGSLIELPQNVSNVFETLRLENVITGKETISGVDFIVHTAKTAIFPLKTGEITIPESKFVGEIVQNISFEDPFRSSSFRNMMSLTNLHPMKRIALSSEPLKINVKPKAYSDKPWLPAKKVTVNDILSPMKPSYKEGETITRIITIKSEGQIANNLPKVTMREGQNYNIYPGKSENSNNFNPEYGFLGEVKQEFVIVPLQQGSLTLPKYEVTYFNTVTGKIEVASTIARSLNIEKAQLKESSIVSDVNKIEEAIKDTQETIVKEDFKTVFMKKIKSDPYFIGMIIIIVLLVVLLLMMARKSNHYEKENHKESKSSANKDDTIEFSDSHNFRKEMKNAISYGNASSAKNIAIKWYNHEFNDTLTTIEAVALKLNDGDFNKEAEILNTVLYSKEDLTWSGDRFLSIFLKAMKKEKSDDKKPPVPSLYPF